MKNVEEKYLEWSFSTKENFEKAVSEIREVLSKHEDVADFDMAFDEVLYNYEKEGEFNDA